MLWKKAYTALIFLLWQIACAVFCLNTYAAQETKGLMDFCFGTPLATAELNGHQYALFDEAVDSNGKEDTLEQFESQVLLEEYCEKMGGHLVTISSEEEQQIAEQLMQSGKKNFYWTGGMIDEETGAWKWITENENFAYEHWASGQPDNGVMNPLMESVSKGVVSILEKQFSGETELSEKDLETALQIAGGAYDAAAGTEEMRESTIVLYNRMNPGGLPGIQELSEMTGFSEYGFWNDLAEDGTCGDEEFFGMENSGFICEWDNNIALSLHDVWSFDNSDVAKDPMGVEHYYLWFPPGFAELLYVQWLNGWTSDPNSRGYCAGMVYTAAAISKYGYPKVSSFKDERGEKIKALDQLKKWDTGIQMGPFTKVTPLDMIKYGFAYQKTFESCLAQDWNRILSDDPEESEKMAVLAEKVRSSVKSGKMVELYVQHEIISEGKKSNANHALLALGIGIDDDTKTQILVYDCNRPEEVMSLLLFKGEDGGYISWTYDPGYLCWNGGDPADSLTYTSQSEVFGIEMLALAAAKKNKDTLEAAKFNTLLELSDYVACKVFSGGAQHVPDEEGDFFLKVPSSNVGPDGIAKQEDAVYWIKSQGPLRIENGGEEENEISVAYKTRVIQAVTPAGAALLTEDADDGCTASVETKAGERFSLTVTICTEGATEDGEPTVRTKEIRTSGKTSGTVSIQEKAGVLDMKGADSAVIEVLEDGETLKKVSEASLSGPVCVDLSDTESSGEIRIASDTDNDGVYEKELEQAGSLEDLLQLPQGSGFTDILKQITSWPEKLLGGLLDGLYSLLDLLLAFVHGLIPDI